MGIWGDVISTAGSVLGGYLEGQEAGDQDQEFRPQDKVLPKTVSGSDMTNFEVLYSQEAVEALKSLTDSLNDWSNTDRNFFENTFLPYQQSLVQANLGMAQTIEKVAGSTLEANLTDIVSNEALKETFRLTAGEGLAPDSGVIQQADRFFQQLDELPTESELVGQALTQVESQFTGIGKQLTRDFASRGQAVSQASRRELLTEKAKAKAGAAGVAGVTARQERLAGFERGVGVAGQVEQLGQAAKSSATANLIGLQTSQQAGLATPQIGGVEKITGIEEAQLTAGLVKSEAGKTLGTSTQSQTAKFEQAGVKTPVFAAIEEGVGG